MPDTGGLGFQPVLHNITPEQVLFCYRAGDADSESVANYYLAARELPPENLISLPCVSSNIITEAEYIATIENPLLDAMTTLGTDFDSQGSRSRWVIVLGYNIPHAFYRSDDPYGDVIAIASRLHRLGFAADYKKSNYAYDRRGAWKFYDLNDARNILLTSVIDGPTADDARNLIDRAIDVDNQTFVTGKVYVDPYGKKSTEDQLDFQSSILDFMANELNFLGLESEVTIDTIDPYSEPIVSAFNHDSFYWGWYTPRYSKDLFLNQNERRVFLYNADDDSAANIKETFDPNGSDPWCNIAIGINPGYAACAGSVSPPGEDTYLRPRPFFEALHRGATLAEAFLYASPYMEWKTFLIGDPLMVVNFPLDLPPDQDSGDNTLPNNEVIRRVKLNFEESLAWGLRQSNLAQTMLDINVQSSNFSEELNLLKPIAIWRDQKNQPSRQNLISLALSEWLNYILKTDNRTLNEWLEVNSEQISIPLSDAINTIASGVVESENVYPAGHWDWEFTYTHELLTFEDIHFEIEVHNNTSFTELVLSVSSFADIGGWKYESEPYIFVQLPESGFPSNFSGRRTKYISFTSNEYLTTAEVYYIRWRALDSSGIAIADWNEDQTGKIITR
ncbi:hypothetical protein LCGC14_1289720 [marine sediment metagenome]|uniref:Uncharacterized protein n=1 Tax=marine sediment metagenome TaxID=412755 RepID=A0A0F9KUH6_9ZZZZ